MRLGLIAGNGRFPFLVLDAARGAGHDVTVIALKEETFPELAECAARPPSATLHWISIGQLGTCIGLLRDAGVTEAVMAGQVKHTKMFDLRPDLALAKVLARLATRNTDSLISGVADALRDQGIRLIDSTAFLQPLMAREGTLTRRAPDAGEQRDLEFGYRVADAIAALDVGQTIAVKSAAVVAVEAMEGTDAMLRRAASLVEGKPLRLVKASGRRRHLLFDVPVVGPQTICVMQETGTTALAVDAGRTLLLDREELLEKANMASITITSTQPQS